MKFFLYTTPWNERRLVVKDPRGRVIKDVSADGTAGFRDEMVALAMRMESEGLDVKRIDYNKDSWHRNGIPAPTCVTVETDDGVLLAFITPQAAGDLDGDDLLAEGGALHADTLAAIESKARAVLSKRAAAKQQKDKDRSKVNELIGVLEADGEKPLNPKQQRDAWLSMLRLVRGLALMLMFFSGLACSGAAQTFTTTDNLFKPSVTATGWPADSTNYGLVNDNTDRIDAHLPITFHPNCPGVSVGDVVFINSSGEAQAAQADVAGTARIDGLVYETVAGTPQACRIIMTGHLDGLTDDAGGALVQGTLYFLSDTVAGGLDSVEPGIGVLIGNGQAADTLIIAGGSGAAGATGGASTVTAGSVICDTCVVTGAGGARNVAGTGPTLAAGVYGDVEGIVAAAGSDLPITAAAGQTASIEFDGGVEAVLADDTSGDTTIRPKATTNQTIFTDGFGTTRMTIDDVGFPIELFGNVEVGGTLDVGGNQINQAGIIQGHATIDLDLTAGALAQVRIIDGGAILTADSGSVDLTVDLLMGGNNIVDANAYSGAAGQDVFLSASLGGNVTISSSSGRLILDGGGVVAMGISASGVPEILAAAARFDLNGVPIDMEGGDITGVDDITGVNGQNTLITMGSGGSDQLSLAFSNGALGISLLDGNGNMIFEPKGNTDQIIFRNSASTANWFVANNQTGDLDLSPLGAADALNLQDGNNANRLTVTAASPHVLVSGDLETVQLRQANTESLNAASPVALAITDDHYQFADTVGGDVEYDLPTCDATNDNIAYTFTKLDVANAMLLDPNGAELIDGASTTLSVTGLRDFRTIYCKSTGKTAGWIIVGRN